MSARFHKLGPLMSGENSRAFLAVAANTAGHGTPEPRVLIWLHEDVVKDADAMQAVRRETRRAEQLEHPNIVRVYGLAEEPEGIARVVEYADAESLRRILQASVTLSPAMAARIVVDVATGLHYAHIAGNDDGTPLVHGDLRPETVLIGYSGITKVGGYGALAAAPREPGGRRVQGRRQHCAPEQVVGGREAVNVQTDVYLLGVLLYELLSGHVPYSELPPNEFDGAVLTFPPPPLPVGERPPELEAVLRRAMAKKAFDRYPTPLAFREAIERAMQDAIASQEDVARFLNELFPDEGHSSPRSARRQMITEAIARVASEEKAGGGSIATATSSPAGSTTGASAPSPDAPPAASTPAVAAVTGISSPSAPPPSAASPASGGSPAGSEAVGATPGAAREAAASAVGSTVPAPEVHDSSGAEASTPFASAASPRRSLALPLIFVGVLAATAVGYVAWNAGVLGGKPAEEVTEAAVVDEGDAGADPDAGAVAVAVGEGELGDAGVADAGEAMAVLDLFVDPSVDVTIDGVAVGRAPLKVPLEPGRHVLVLSDKRKLIQVTRVVELQPPGGRREFYLSKGFVNVTAPDGAEILVDGKSFGPAPVKEIALYEGSHQIRVNIGESRWQESFNLKPNERVRFDVDFQ